MNSLKGGAGRKEEVFQTFFFSFLHGIRSLLWSGEKKYKLPLSYPSSSYFYTNVSGYKSKAEKRKTNLFSSLVWPNVVVRLKHWLCQKMTPPKKEKWKMHLTRGANQEEDDGGRRRRKGFVVGGIRQWRLYRTINIKQSGRNWRFSSWVQRCQRTGQLTKLWG